MIGRNGQARWGRLGGLALFLLAMGCEATPGRVQRVEEMVEAHNAHDVDGQLVLFAEDARVLLPDRSVIEGRPRIRELLEWDASLRHRYTFEELEARGDTVVAGRVHEESRWFDGAGIGRVRHEPGTRIVFREGRIVEIRFAPLVASDLSRSRQAIGDFVQWAAEARPDLLDTLLPGNRFMYSQDAAVAWIEALGEWREGGPVAH